MLVRSAPLLADAVHCPLTVDTDDWEEAMAFVADRGGRLQVGPAVARLFARVDDEWHVSRPQPGHWILATLHEEPSFLVLPDEVFRGAWVVVEPDPEPEPTPAPAPTPAPRGRRR